MNVGLWVVQVLLAVLFGMAGVMKLSMPLAELAQKLPWVPEVPAALVRFIGLAELSGALGLILPAATRIKPMLTVFAAMGLTTVMVMAAGFHFTRGELPAIVFNAVLGGLSGFVVWGRLRKVPITARSRS